MTRADSLGSPAALLGTPLVRQTSGAKRWLDRYRELVAARGGAGSLTREDLAELARSFSRLLAEEKA